MYWFEMAMWKVDGYTGSPVEVTVTVSGFRMVVVVVVSVIMSLPGRVVVVRRVGWEVARIVVVVVVGFAAVLVRVRVVVSLTREVGICKQLQAEDTAAGSVRVEKAGGVCWIETASVGTSSRFCTADDCWMFGFWQSVEKMYSVSVLGPRSTTVVSVTVDVVVETADTVIVDTFGLPLVMTVVVSVDVACSVTVELMVTVCVVDGIERKAEQYSCPRAC